MLNLVKSDNIYIFLKNILTLSIIVCHLNFFKVPSLLKKKKKWLLNGTYTWRIFYPLKYCNQNTDDRGINLSDSLDFEIDWY